MRRAWFLVVACGIAASCGDGGPAIPPACREGGCRSQRDETALFQQAIIRDVDVLFVVDDTPDLAVRADALTASYRRAAQLLGPGAPLPGGAPSVRVAFVPASRSAAASPQARAAGCGVIAPDAFLGTGPCGRTPNTTRPFEDAFSCLADLGHDSPARLEPFAATRRALDGGAEALAGFLRPNAFLQIVIVAGADDSSSSDVTALVQFLKGLKADPHHVLVAVVGPAVDGADAAPPTAPPRLLELVQSFGANGVYVTLSTDDPVTKAFIPFVASVSPLDGSACLQGVRDTDPTLPGLQPDCVVEDRVYPEVNGGFSSTPVTAVLPDCAHGAPPCWRLTPGPYCGPDGVALSFDRGPDWCPQAETISIVTCLSCLHADDPACHGG